MSFPKHISDNFVVLTPDKHAHIEPFNANLYGRLDAVYGGFVGHELIACHSFTQDWGSWEMHPHGDEVVVLLSGAVRFVLQTPGGDTAVLLSEQGHYVVVPKGVWHTAAIISPAKLLFITPGQGTEHRPA
ncbi:MAG TPA: cupin domain-containing protein [Cellvibrionaceae bacterium]|nr:cupin domain-containing protein [Cellvibrionaceae bacterium]HMW49934.1 cupin domain-containing protein [Cellvibrionaceae bacterium]HMW73882.1 cupin domain-containing protein [Cellvibrionaceae bacterium]HNG61888.1 cupin domain-containing protein [Cellvibrionaceae bacterium]